MSSSTGDSGNPDPLPATDEPQHETSRGEQLSWDPVASHHSGSVPQQGTYVTYGPTYHTVQPHQQPGHPYQPYPSNGRAMNSYPYAAPPFPRHSSDPYSYARPPNRSNTASTGSHDSVPYGATYVSPYHAVSSTPSHGQAGRTRWAWVQMEVPDTHPQDDIHSQYTSYPNSVYQASAANPLYQPYGDHSAPVTYTMQPDAQYNPYNYPRHPGHYPPPHTMMPNRPPWQPPVMAPAASVGHSAAVGSSNRRHPSSRATSGVTPRRSGTGASSTSSTLSSPHRGGTILPPKPPAVDNANADILEDNRSGNLASPAALESTLAASPISDDGNEPSPSSQEDAHGDQTMTIPGRGLRPHYHPQQGPRSDFVMWCGNVPQNATVEELWELFSRLPLTSAEKKEIAEPDEHNAHATEEDSATLEADHGVLSIFIISRSNCAFVNYASALHLELAVEHFHGQQVRPQDARCPKLVCRIRKKDDEAQAGVAGQRNRGIHVAWLKEQKLADPAEATAGAELATSPAADESLGSEPLSAPFNTTTLKDTQGGTLSAVTAGSYSSSGSTSYASTNSSLLRHPAFRHRFFILKSLRRDDLDRSIETGYWSTQPHNEAVLDQAYRNSESVYLIFGVNQTGQFHGYARMAGLINTATELKSKEDQRQGTSNQVLSNVSSTTSSSTIIESANESDSGEDGKEHPKLISADIDAAQALFTDSAISNGFEEPQLPMTSPLPISPMNENTGTTDVVDRSEGGTSTPRRSISRIGSIAQSSSWPYASIKSTAKTTALPRDHDQRRSESPTSSSAQTEADSQGVVRRDTETLSPITSTPGESVSLGPTDSASWSSGDARLAEQIALRAVIHNLRLDEMESRGKAEVLENQLRSSSNHTDATVTTATPAESVADTTESSDPPRHSSSDSWGKPFRVEWIRTDQLPFHRIKKLRNPWRDNRQIKVSRDGTELEPGVGQQLLLEWNRNDASASTASTASRPSTKPRHPVGSDEDE